jgi:hypothetical protein
MRVATLELSDDELRDAAMAARAAAWRAQHDADNQSNPRSNATFAAVAARYAALAEMFEHARRSLPIHSAKPEP